VAVAAPPSTSGSHRQERHTTRPREHHVTEDFSYVKRDLWLIAGVGTVCLAFIVALSFFVS
jgi:hypothetical protein